MMQKLRHHPDLGGDPSLAQLLNLAADTLCDPVRRARYDSQLRESERERTKQSPNSEKRSGESSGESSADNSRRSAGETPHENSAGHSEGGARQASSRDSADTSRESGSGHTTGARHKPSEQEAPTVRAHLPARPHCLFCGATRAASTPARRQPYGAGRQCLRCEAPAVLIEELPQSLSEELRRMYRHDIQDSVTLWSHWPKESAIAATLQDLSLAGCAVECREALIGDSMVLLETQLLSAICQVRYCKPGNTGNQFQIGLQFRTLNIKAQPGTVFSTVA